MKLLFNFVEVSKNGLLMDLALCVKVKAAIDVTSKIAKERSDSLNDKERRLKNYQFKIQQKQKFLDEMAVIIRALNMFEL